MISRPLDAAAVALAAALGLLAFGQWRASSSFGRDAVATTAEVVELRTAARALLDPEAAVFATVELETAEGQTVRAELPSSVQSLGLDPRTLEGARIPIRYDPSDASTVRYAERSGGEAALVLALLAGGALFAPMILRQSALRNAGARGG
ncbi:MAG: DUF3592 domain-containing protein [Planctomycetota bacterium]